MTNFHVSRSDGMVRRCNAQSPETCTADTPPEIKEHFTNKEDAEKAYEKVMDESRLPRNLAKRNGGKMPKRVILGPDNIARPAPKDPAVTKSIENLKKTKEEREQDRTIRSIEGKIKEKQKKEGLTDAALVNYLNKQKRKFGIVDEKRNNDTAELEASFYRNVNKLEKSNYVINNIDSYDGLPGGKAATLVHYAKEASNAAKNVFESANTIQESKNLFSKNQLNQHKENYEGQLKLEEKSIKEREKDLKRRYGFFQRRNDPDSKLVYNDNMAELNERKQEIQKEKESLFNLSN